MTLLTLLQNYGTPPVPPPPTNTADIGPGDYSSVYKEFPLPGAVKKRPRLRNSVIKRVKELAKTPEPSREQIEALTNAVKGDREENAEFQKLISELENSLARLARDKLQQNAEAERERERLMTEAIALFLHQQEEDELLIAYLI